MTNSEVAELLRAVAAAYEIRGGAYNRFKVIAYQNAATGIEHATSEIKDLWEQGKLKDIPGIGQAIAQYLDELFRTGGVKHFKAVFKKLPPGFFSLLKLSGIGAKTAYRLIKELKIKKEDAIGEVEKAAKAGKIREIPGFGEQKEKLILQSIEERNEKKAVKERMLLPIASVIAEDMVYFLRKHPKVKLVEPLGSLRRQVATVGDVDIAVASSSPKVVISHFTKYPKIRRIIEAGKHTSSILLASGAQVDLMVQPENAFGALLAHFTGSKQHNIALREYALKRGMSLSEYGIKTKIKNAKFKSQNYNSKLKLYQFPTEESFYDALGLEWIPPELREDVGEIEASHHSAEKQPGGLPHLVELKDIKGDFHLHSDFNIHTSHDEGTSSFKQMIYEAEKLRYEYIGFSEHNPSQSGNTKTQISSLIKRKREAIDKLNYSSEKPVKRSIQKVFNGLEVDIQPDGKLAIPEDALELLDYIIVSVHSSFRQTKTDQTKRVLTALYHPKAKIFGHPTARRLNKREGIELDWELIFEFCKKHNKFLEINSWYDRLDLSDDLVREAVKSGVKMIIDTDSHALDQMHLMRYGVSVARRGWAEKKDIANTLSYDKFAKEFIG